MVLLLWRTRLRASWRAALALVVLMGLGGSVALAVAAGARRTASANDAILDAGNASDVVTGFAFEHPDEVGVGLRTVPGIAAVNLWVGFRSGPSEDPSLDLIPIGWWSDPPTVDRPFLTAGRLPTGPAEAMLNQGGAAKSGLGVGSRHRMALADREFSDFESIEVEIVGIGLLPDEVVEDELGKRPAIFFSRALTEQHLDRQQFGLARLSVAPGALATVAAGLEARGGEGLDDFRGEDRSRVQKAQRPLLGALAGLSLLAGLATVAVAAQALGRTLRRRRADDQSLAAMGCTTRQLVAADLAYAVVVAAGAVVVACGLAVGASGLFPIGPTRRVEVGRGIDLDLTVLGAGSVVLAAGFLALVGLGSWRRRSRTRPASPGFAPGPLGASPVSATGLRLVTGQRSSTATIAGIGAALLVVFTTLTFTGSLGHLAGDPALVGMTWDVLGREGYTFVDHEAVRATVAGDPAVERVSGLAYLDGSVDGVPTPMAEVRLIASSPWPPLAQGRVPVGTDEILVGRATLRQLHRSVGDLVQVAVGSHSFDEPDTAAVPPRGFTIVGSAVTPTIGLAGYDTPRLDVGILLAEGTYQSLYGEPIGPDVVLFDLAAGERPEALIARFPDGLPDRFSSSTEWFTSAAPAEIDQAEEARTVIWVGVGGLAVAVVATIVHTLLGSVRRRSAYAVLKALGFTPRQVRATVLWQGATLLVVAMMAGLPLGAAAGRWLWTAFADGLGVVVEPVIPVLLLGASALVTILVVLGAALVPATIARRSRTGPTLRTE